MTCEHVFLQALEILCRCLSLHLYCMVDWTIYFPISVSLCFFNRYFEFHSVVKPNASQSWFVKRFNLVEFIFIAWQIRNMFVGHRWQLFDDGKWVLSIFPFSVHYLGVLMLSCHPYKAQRFLYQSEARQSSISSQISSPTLCNSTDHSYAQ